MRARLRGAVRGVGLHDGHVHPGRSHIARWVAATAVAAAVAHNGNEALSCAPIAPLSCQSDMDCQSIDLGAVCVAIGRDTSAKRNSSDDAAHAQAPGSESRGGCRCSRTRYTDDFCERSSMDTSPAKAAGSSWSAAPAAGGVIAVAVLVSLVAIRLRRNTPRVFRTVHKKAGAASSEDERKHETAQTFSVALPRSPPLLLEGKELSRSATAVTAAITAVAHPRA